MVYLGGCLGWVGWCWVEWVGAGWLDGVGWLDCVGWLGYAFFTSTDAYMLVLFAAM